MSKEILISLIIPVYNTEKYLPICMESIYSQKQLDIEIILINDGSTDDSGALCDKYGKAHSNTIVIHQVNKGVSAARNTGIERARGEYLLFIDSDDLLAKDAIKQIITTIVKGSHPDIIAGYYMTFSNNDGEFQAPNCMIDTSQKVLTKHIIVKNFTELLKSKRFEPGAGANIVKRKLVLTNRLRFNENLINNEDIDFSIGSYIHSMSIYATAWPHYCYRKYRENSATYSVNEDKVVNSLWMISKWVDYNSTHIVDKSLQDELFVYLRYQYMIATALTYTLRSTVRHSLYPELASLKTGILRGKRDLNWLFLRTLSISTAGAILSLLLRYKRTKKLGWNNVHI